MKGLTIKESSIQNSILRYLNEFPHCKAYNMHGNAMQGAGRPDMVACYRGHFIAIEVKRPGEKPTKIQEHELRLFGLAGAVTLVAESLDDVKALIRMLDQKTWD